MFLKRDLGARLSEHPSEALLNSPARTEGAVLSVTFGAVGKQRSARCGPCSQRPEVELAHWLQQPPERGVQ